MRTRGGIGLVTAAAAFALAGAAAGCGEGRQEAETPAPAPALANSFDADRAFEHLREQVELGPRPSGSPANRRLVRLLGARLQRAGVEGVRVQRPHRNVVGVIPGREPGYVVVGAHHDTKDEPPTLGANDGASGVAVVLELARALPRRLPGPSVAIALFDAEEARGDRDFLADGFRGSRQYVAYASSGAADGRVAEGGRVAGARQGTPPLGEIRAMVLFDMVGDCDLQVPHEANSSRRLHQLFVEASGGAPFTGERGPILDDHIPFLAARIEAVNLIDFTFGPGDSPGAYWHTEEDALDKVCPESLGAVGQAALEAIPRIR